MYFRANYPLFYAHEKLAPKVFLVGTGGKAWIKVIPLLALNAET
jgi:hypothetical protein